MARRVLLVEWTDDAHTVIEARLAVRADDSSAALLVLVSIDLASGQMGQPAIWRCAADPGGERCRVLGGLGRHADVTADLLAGAFAAYGPNSDQEALYAYLEGSL